MSSWMPPMSGVMPGTFTKEEFHAMHLMDFNFEASVDELLKHGLEGVDGGEPFIKSVKDTEAIASNKYADEKEEVFGIHWPAQYYHHRALYTYTDAEMAKDVDKNHEPLRARRLQIQQQKDAEAHTPTTSTSDKFATPMKMNPWGTGDSE